MATESKRTFEDRPAVREATPLLVGLIGPSSSGKTFSALRLATGIQRVAGGDIYFIDTEARRALHYAERFKFRHIDFKAPFGSLDYLAAIEHCVAKGAKTIVVDSMSHEHEGAGGHLEAHAIETTRLAAAWRCSEAKAQISAWNTPKAERRRLINTVLQLPANFIFCFRAKEKLKIVTGKDPLPLGFMPIAGQEFVYEMVVKCLLLPGANGTPTWSSEHAGERMMMKLPEQFRAMFREPKQLDEDTGEKLARWAAGGTAPARAETSATDADPVMVLAAEYAACCDDVSFDALEKRRKDLWSKITGAQQRQLKAASDEAKASVTEQAAVNE